MPTPVKIAATVSEIVEHAPDLRSIFLTPERRVPPFAPGQFLHLAMDAYEPGAHWPESRVFSIASSPLERQQLRITISRQGTFTTRMFSELHVGSRIWLKLPYGTFCPNADLPGRMILFAGGSGITPFVSFLQWATAAKPGVSIDLHYGARTPDLLIFRDAVERCQREGLTDLRARYYVEQAPGGAPDPSLVIGRLSAADAWHALPEPATCRFYLSGPRAMIERFRMDLLHLGAHPDSVLSDDWS